MTGKIRVIDIFAGPGGLGEGFSSFQTTAGRSPFQLEVSAEMEASAHATLRLRAFYRLLRQVEGRLAKKYLEYLRTMSLGRESAPEDYFSSGPLKSLWREAGNEALNLTLGNAAHNELLHARVAVAKRTGDPLILIGGPPCQAYSIVGRARNTNVKTFRTKGDTRHFLYRQYLEILAQFSPDVFIMENVKGILSSTVGGQNMFAQICTDLADPARALGLPIGKGQEAHPEYLLLPIHAAPGEHRDATAAALDPKSFVIRCEDHGAPQARHRVIIMGVRMDHSAAALRAPGLPLPSHAATVGDALSGLPKLRSGLSKGLDGAEAWMRVADKQRSAVRRSLRKSDQELKDRLESVKFSELPRSASRYVGRDPLYLPGIRSVEQDVVLNHSSRSHMPSDLGRYLYCAAFGQVKDRSPVSSEFPLVLAPDHANWHSGTFADRFRVQLKERPSSTVTSHLSKDGHAFIHHDPAQCRSLTVREAARLQTFPDDYLFLGNRTQQFVQVGNAVPPMIAGQIASVVWSILGNSRTP
jgi:DNA (cytosine-5)-methyltransferase 1